MGKGATEVGKRGRPGMLAGSLDVLLIQMPFADLHMPSIGLSLLKGALERRGIWARVQYFNLRFAQLTEFNPYLLVSDESQYRTYAQVGEWIFSSALFEQSDREIREYVDCILRLRAGPRGNVLAPVSEEFIEAVLPMRALVPGFLDECLHEVLARRPRIVGFSSMFQQQLASLALARRIKARLPETFVVFGGYNCQEVMGLELMRQFPFVDGVVSGDGDEAFPELVQRVLEQEPLSGIEGVCVRSDPALPASPLPALTTACVHDLDKLPPLDYDDYFQELEALGSEPPFQPVIPFETSRGCSWGQKRPCAFCGMNGRNARFRAKSGAHAMDELQALSKKYPGRAIYMTDNMLSANYFKDLIPGLTARCLEKIILWCVRPSLTKGQLSALREAGVQYIQPGIESFSDPVLRLMGKGARGLANVQLLKWSRELGFHAAWNILWGFPSEPPEEYARMARLVPLLTHLEPPRGSGRFILGRFSPLFERAEALGLARVAPSPAYRYIYPLDPEATANLAIYFVYDYGLPQDVEAYTRPLLEATHTWSQVHETSGLWALEGRDRLFVWDQRPVAVKRLTVLTGARRTLYLACDEIRDLRQLRQILKQHDGKRRSAHEVEALLQPMVDSRLMLRQGNEFLSLAALATLPADQRRIESAIQYHRKQLREEEVARREPRRRAGGRRSF